MNSVGQESCGEKATAMLSGALAFGHHREFKP